MNLASNRLLLLLDDIFEDWFGVELPRPVVAMRGFKQEDGCQWCGETNRLFEPCPCGGRRIRWTRVFRLGSYAPPLSTSIMQGKYAVWPEMLSFLGKQLGDRVKGCVPPNTVIVPMPMPIIRRYIRRIDHAYVIAKHASKQCGIPIRRALWRRESTPQAAKTASMRKSLPSSVMRIRFCPRIKGKNVLLIDDVLTTGKSLEVAANQLKRAGVLSIQVAVLAVTEMPQKGKKL
ncbi:MAG: ComF family protein [Phycisphaerae bacterium]|jgi:predicted amidophosphoribosyltransferase|nr:ComF family protein [Phycisphaerae bacterium]